MKNCEMKGSPLFLSADVLNGSDTDNLYTNKAPGRLKNKDVKASLIKKRVIQI